MEVTRTGYGGHTLFIKHLNSTDVTESTKFSYIYFMPVELMVLCLCVMDDYHEDKFL